MVAKRSIGVSEKRRRGKRDERRERKDRERE